MVCKQFRAQLAYAGECVASQAWFLGMWAMLDTYTRTELLLDKLSLVRPRMSGGPSRPTSSSATEPSGTFCPHRADLGNPASWPVPVTKRYNHERERSDQKTCSNQ
jgi:hypothetical protein